MATAHETAFSFTFENDLFFSTDKYYTDGVQLNVRTLNAPQSETVNAVKVWACRAVGCSGDDFQEQQHRVGQLMYTPVDITSPFPQPADRPWAGMFYYSNDLEFLSSDKKTLTILTGMLGIIGPHSYVEQTQKWIHRTFGARPPQGWSNQIGNELGLMAAVERRHAVAAWNAGQRDGVQGRAAAYWRAAAGNIMTYAGTGFAVAVGKHLPLVASREAGGISEKVITLSPAAADQLSADQTACLVRWLRCTAFASAEARLLLWNIFLDGRAFGSGPSVTRRPVVVEASGGLRLDLPTTRTTVTGPWFVQFKATRRSPEFRSAATVRSQTFGALTVGTDF